MRIHTMLIASALVVSAGCAIPLNLAPSVVTVPDGQWSGTTQQGKPITFTVRNQRVTELAVAYRIDLSGCPSDGADAMQPDVALTSIMFGAGEFLYQYESPSSAARVTVSGFFNSTASLVASGSLSITLPACPGQTRTSWSAAKQ